MTTSLSAAVNKLATPINNLSTSINKLSISISINYDNISTMYQWIKHTHQSSIKDLCGLCVDSTRRLRIIRALPILIASTLCLIFALAACIECTLFESMHRNQHQANFTNTLSQILHTLRQRRISKGRKLQHAFVSQSFFLSQVIEY